MSSLISDPALREQLLKLKEEGQRRVDRARAELAGAQRELDAVTSLLASPGPVLSGDTLRAEAHKLLKEMDPNQKGVHYQVITKELLNRGFQISGKAVDKAPNVRSTIGAGPRAALMFKGVGASQGTYTWT